MTVNHAYHACRGRTFLKCLALVILALALLPRHILAQNDKPKVAILVYDGVQVIDHAVPFEVFGQFSLNEVYTVAKEAGPLTAYMGMRILPNYSFADAPAPDVVVLPGGDAGEAMADPEIRGWIDRVTAGADHVLTICTGIFFLEGNELLNGSRVTTWYDRQDDLHRLVHEKGGEVVSDRIVVESGRLVSAAGLGVEASLRVLARLHGKPWAEIVRLNMEYEPLPDSLRIPRVELADLKLPGGIYSVFPWRQAELLTYEGDRDEWVMEWRFEPNGSLDSLHADLLSALKAEEGWSLASEEEDDSVRTGHWQIRNGDGQQWSAVARVRDLGAKFALEIEVRR